MSNRELAMTDTNANFAGGKMEEFLPHFTIFPSFNSQELPSTLYTNKTKTKTKTYMQWKNSI